MRKVSLFLVAAAGLAALVVQGSSLGQERAGKKPPYVHNVIFYVKSDAKDAVPAMIADSHKLLADIPSVRGLWVGRPADKATPKVAVNDYSLGLTILFDDAKGLEDYLVHPQHEEFVQRHLGKVEKVLVYDFANQTK